MVRFGASGKPHLSNPPRPAPQHGKGAFDNTLREPSFEPIDPSRPRGFIVTPQRRAARPAMVYDKKDKAGASAENKDEQGIPCHDANEAFAGQADHGIGGDHCERHRPYSSLEPLVALVRQWRDAGEQLRLRERAEPEDAPLVSRSFAPQPDGSRNGRRGRNNGQGPHSGQPR